MHGLGTERTLVRRQCATHCRNDDFDKALNRPLVFPCHSMGGFIAKKCLLCSSLRSTYRPIVRSTMGVVFFGTPHLGSSLGALLSIVNRIATALRFKSRSCAHAELQILAPGLSEINVDVAEIGSHISMVSIFEERDIKGVEKAGSLRKG